MLVECHHRFYYYPPYPYPTHCNGIAYCSSSVNLLTFVHVGKWKFVWRKYWILIESTFTSIVMNNDKKNYVNKSEALDQSNKFCQFVTWLIFIRIYWHCKSILNQYNSCSHWRWCGVTYNNRLGGKNPSLSTICSD